MDSGDMGDVFSILMHRYRLTWAQCLRLSLYQVLVLLEAAK